MKTLWCERCARRHATQISAELVEAWCDGCVAAAGARGGRWRDAANAKEARAVNAKKDARSTKR
jgi:hypothetical protein